MTQHTKAPPPERGTGEPRPERDEAAPRTPVGDLLGRLGDGNVEAIVGQHRSKLIWVGALLVVVAVLGVTPINLGRLLVNGLEQGSIIALVSLGLALVYTSTRVLNFAQGEFGSMAAFVVLGVLLAGDLGADLTGDEMTPLSVVGISLTAICVGVGVALVVNVVVRRLNSPFASLVATAAIFMLLQGVQYVFFGINRSFPRLVEGNAFGIFGTQVSWQALIIVGVLAGVTLLLAMVFRTPVGVALLASAQEPYAASLHGVSPKAMSMLAWGMAGALGGMAGLLLGGVYRMIQPGFMTTDYLVPAFTAALLGGITSMTGAVVGALMLGLVVAAASQLVTGYGLDGMIPNAPVAASFIVLLVVLALRPTGLLGKGK